MKAELPDDLKAILVELSECQGIVDDDQYSEEDRNRLEKLASAGLVSLSWVLTPLGKKVVKE